MWSYSRTLPTFWLTCSLAVGCATAGGARTTSTPAVTVEPKDVVEPVEEHESIPGWPAYYSPILLGDISGTDEDSGKPASISRGYLFHRIDVEKIRVLKLHANRCDEDLAHCETKVAEATALPSFWSRTEGHILLVAIGVVVGVGATVGIVYAVGGSP